jgi:hypothetical protein
MESFVLHGSGSALHTQQKTHRTEARDAWRSQWTRCLASADDDRLNGWYHTLGLAPGIVTRAVWDHRSTVDRVGLPPSLAGKTALDVGRAVGLWAFEMERRGADRVVATDVARAGDVDLLPRHRAL